MSKNNFIESDIGMIFEGSYPYISGGVSSWAQQLIESLPELTFSIITILPDEKPRTLKYDLPKNVKNLHHIYIHDKHSSKHLYVYRNWKWIETIEDFHMKMPKIDISAFETMADLFLGPKSPKMEHLLNSKASFNMLQRIYKRKADDESFLDYFWTWRFMHLGLIRIMKAPLFSCRLYHAISTGYCGIYGALLKYYFKRPYFLTEHGIYTRERKIEIHQSEWIFDKRKEEIRPERALGAFKSMWFKAFSIMSFITYHFADEIITLFPGNQKYQLEDGADPKRLRLIYNGIDFETYHVKETGRIPGRFTLALIGRVVPVKDIKTFLRCIKILSYQIPELKALVMGPTDEDPKYFHDCLQLSRLLKIEKTVEFVGKVKVIDYYSRVDVLVLTSISEAQPLVILEAGAAGIPVVATDVGDCRDLLYGREGVIADRQLGQSGFVFNMANPKEAAEHIYTLYKDLTLFKKLSQAGIERTARFYKKEYQINSYRKLYHSYIDKMKKDQGAVID